MSKVDICISEASAGIDKYLKELKELNVSLEKKKGSDSIVLRDFLIIVYFLGLVSCVIWATMFKRISLAPVNEGFGSFVTISAGVSSAIFFLTLIIRKLLDAKAFKMIQRGQRDISRKINRLNKVRNSCSNFERLIDDGNDKIDYVIDLGEDVPAFIGKTDDEINKVKIGKANSVDGFLIFMYFMAAFAVGAFIILYIQSGFRNMLGGILTKFNDAPGVSANWSKGVYTACSSIAIIGGPIFAWCYFDNILMIELRESLIFLIMGSSILAFIALVIAAAVIAGVIAGVIALVCVIVKVVLYILGGIAILAILVGIIYAILGG